jgi:DNA polymerase elongation subunit (family B)
LKHVSNVIVHFKVFSKTSGIPSFKATLIKKFHIQLVYTLFDCKDSSEILTKGYENALLLVTQAIGTIMTGEGIEDKDLVISELLRQNIEKYKSLFPHVFSAIQV